MTETYAQTAVVELIGEIGVRATLTLIIAECKALAKDMAVRGETLSAHEYELKVSILGAALVQLGSEE